MQAIKSQENMTAAIKWLVERERVTYHPMLATIQESINSQIINFRRKTSWSYFYFQSVFDEIIK